MTKEQGTFHWAHEALHLEIVLDDDGSPRLTHLGLPGETQRIPGASLPLVEVTAAGHGRGWSGNRLVGTDLGGRLRHRTHRTTHDGDWHTLTVHLHDPETGLVAEVTYRSPDGIPVLRSEVTLRNVGQTTLHLESVSSFAVGCLTPQEPAAIDAADLLWVENDWLAECRWQRQPMRLTTPAHSGRVSHANGRAGFAVNGQGTWSSCGRLPMGGLTDRHTGRTWVWQIEHNGGGWRWECGERDKAAYAALFGPTDTHHGWRHPLEPGAVFRTVPAALSFSDDGGPDEAFAALTRYRRAQRRPHADHQRLPVIFNDYMNCLMGDPTTEKLLPHIDAAADAGAEYFVIDAGWYDGDDGGWWDSVGAWEPAASRFPGTRGIHEVLDRIRERGMVPGLWLEPEVIGVRSPMAKSLPDEAFFRRDGIRVTEAGRHHLDLRHPAARAHLDEVVDRLVGEWGVGYLKLDHNIDPGSGTSAHPGETPAAGLLGHNRAHLDWIDGVLDRYPHLVLENCSSGGMRWDDALLSRMQLQSTSDQQNLHLYAPIAASAPTAVTPEQGAVWAYPQPEDSLDEVAFTMANALLGRIHLSGRIPELEPESRALVHEAVAAYKAIRGDLPGAVPSWLGRPLDRPGPAHTGHHLPHCLAPTRNRHHGDGAPAPPAGHRRPCRSALPLGQSGRSRLDARHGRAEPDPAHRAVRRPAPHHRHGPRRSLNHPTPTSRIHERTYRVPPLHQPDRRLTNPVIPGFHPDPSICRVGDDYYLACSSFEYFPGVPLFHSRDLVHWTQIGNALDRPEQLRLSDAWSSGGIYAPTLRHHDGRFWLIVTNCTEGGGNLIVTATDPTGPWSDPIWAPGVPGIDPDLVWDEDGTCWCTVAGVSQVRLDPSTGQTYGTPHRLWSGGPGAKAPEAPHLYRIGDYWYLLIAEGGTERGHGVSIARGRTPAGPFEPCPDNPILTHRGTDHPVQNTGHADLVQGPDGSWWMVLLGVRPGGGTPGWHVLGRETFLAPVTWVDDWPVVGEVALDLPELPWPLSPSPVEEHRDDFELAELRPSWISLRDRPAEHCTTKERPGWLTLRARGGSLDEPDVVFTGRRQQHRSCRARTLVDATEGGGGLAVRLDERHHYEIEVSGTRVRVVARVGSLRTVVAAQSVPAGPVVLAVTIAEPPSPHGPCTGPDVVSLGVEQPDGTFTELATLDGRYLSTEVAGGFTGRVIGMYAAAGIVHFDWFDYEPLDD